MAKFFFSLNFLKESTHRMGQQMVFQSVVGQPVKRSTYDPDFQGSIRAATDTEKNSDSCSIQFLGWPEKINREERFSLLSTRE